jgi:hypothetical protein
MRKDDGRSPLRGPGHQPSASAAVPASSQSGVPNAGFAPGPWEALREKAGHGWTVRVRSLEEPYPAVAGLCARIDRNDNAALIAAAPRMFSALAVVEAHLLLKHALDRALVLGIVRTALAEASGIVAAPAGETPWRLDERSEQSPAPEGGDAQ